MWWLALLLATHSASQGKSTIEIDAHRFVDVTIDLGALDLPELCNVDLSVESRRAEQEARLDTCVERGLAGAWLMVRGDGRPCPITPEGWRILEPVTTPPTIRMSAMARCERPHRTITLDWGLFRGTSFDHTSVARVLVEGREPQLFLFSKRASRLVVEMPREVPWGVVGVLVAVVALVGVVAGALARRARAARVPPSS